MDGLFCVMFAFWAIFWPVIGYALGKNKGQETSGAAWCFLLGPIGLLILLLLPDIRAQGTPEPHRAVPHVGAIEVERRRARAHIAREEREARSRIEKEERMRLEIRAKLEAEARGENPSDRLAKKLPPPSA